MLTTIALFGLAMAVATCCGEEALAEEGAGQIRARLLATRLETDVTVELRNGQRWKGALTDISENNFLLLAEPDKETRKRLRLGTGTKLKKNIAYYDVVSLEGAPGADLVEKYLVLESNEVGRMKTLLTVASTAGFRVRASAGRRMVLLERVESGEPVEYVVPSDIDEKREKELDEWGAQGFRVAPGTLGAWVGTAGAILEREPGDDAPRDYRILETSREGTLEKELLEAAARGYRVVGLTKPDKRVILLESRAPASDNATAPAEYRLVSAVDSASLDRQVEEGYRLVACSDGEKLCVLERTESAGESYSFLAAARLSTLEKELNDLGRRGHRIHPAALGRDSETFAVLVQTNSSSVFEYRVLSRHGAHKLQTDVALLAREGFAVAAVTSDTKGGGGQASMGGLVGGALDVAHSEMLADVIVVMERSTPPEAGRERDGQGNALPFSSEHGETSETPTVDQLDFMNHASPLKRSWKGSHPQVGVSRSSLYGSKGAREDECREPPLSDPATRFGNPEPCLSVYAGAASHL